MKVERVVLLGFMGAGKSVVGAGLARALGWSHLDLDREIERRERRTVAQIFRDSGEAHFRRLEARLTEQVAARTRIVLSPGGGWITSPGILESMPPGTLSVWLWVSPEVALERARASHTVRPLLQTTDPAATARELLAAREPLYRKANITVSTDGRVVREIVAELLERVRRPEVPHRED